MAIIVTALLLAMVLGLGSILVGQVKLLRGIGHSVVALYAAETGLEAILYEDYQNINDITDCDGSGPQPAFCSRALSNGANFKVIVDDACGTLYCVDSTGTFQNSLRKINIER